MAVPAYLDELPREGLAGEGPRARETRRELRLEAAGALPSGTQTNVLIHNVSVTGLLMESHVLLGEGDAIDIELPEAGMRRARVIWASHPLYGCQFDLPISDAALSAAQLRSAVSAQLELGHRRELVPDEGFAARLHRLRTSAGLTMAALAERLGVSKPTVWAWEQGKAKPVGSRIEALAMALGVPPSELVAGQDDAAVRDLLERIRQQIARTVGTSAERIRISIEL
jgi:transcriptional regulator with XRE-family HTH domain